MKEQFLSLKIQKKTKEIINSCYLAQQNETRPENYMWFATGYTRKLCFKKGKLPFEWEKYYMVSYLTTIVSKQAEHT